MVVAGIVGQDGRVQTANLISSILTSRGKRVSVLDSSNLEGKDLKQIKSYLNELEKNNIDVLIFKINIADVKEETFNSLHFDVMICTDKADDLYGTDIISGRELIRRIFLLLDKKGMAIVNVDDEDIIHSLHGIKHYIITYGFNPKASVTASSIGDTTFEDSFICCLQRTVCTWDGIQVEPQEYKLDIKSKELNKHDVLAAASFAIVSGVDLNV